MAYTDSLYSKEESLRFYEERFAGDGYISNWPVRRQNRLREALLAQGLPETGRMLDYGCGSGPLTALLKKVFPAWEVWGCDISPTGIETARKQFPDCQFFVIEAEQPPAGGFDFIFSHHVLEHVYDLAESAALLASWSKPGGRMLHIMPCGNPGSWEHTVTLLMRDGIDPARGGRFYFEDVGHLRRLRTEGLTDAFAPHGFSLDRALYFGQKWGGMEYLCLDGDETVRNFCDPSRLQHTADLPKLQGLTAEFLAYRQAFAQVWMGRDYYRQQFRAGLTGFSPRKALGALRHLLKFSSYERKKQELEARADAEWKAQRGEPAASEMLLGFVRG